MTSLQKAGLPALLGAAMVLAGCVTTPQPSGQVYMSSETNRAYAANSCRVVNVTPVTVVGNSQADQNRNAANNAVGIIVGGMIGNAIGNEIGNGSGRDLARGLGTVGGAVVGANVAGNMNAQRTTRQGVQYEVDLGRAGWRTVVQQVNPGELILRPGQPCLLVGGYSGARVVPG